MAVDPSSSGVTRSDDTGPAEAHQEPGPAVEPAQRELFTARHLAPVLVLIVGAVAAVLVGTQVTAAGAVPGLLAPGALVHYGLPIARVVLEIGAIGTVGVSLLAKLLGFDAPERTEPVMRPARRAAVLTSLVWIVAALLAIVLQAAELRPGEPLTVGAVVDYVRQVGSGQGLLAAAGVAAIYLVFAVLAVRHGESVPAELRIVLALFALLPIPVTGHASNWRLHDLSMISMELHVVGAAAWTGGLTALVVLLVARPRLLADVLPRFSRLATVCLVGVGLTGVINGGTELLLTPGLPLPSGILTSGYGQLTIAKLGCLLVLGGLGANIRWRLLPAIVRERRTALLGWATLEIAVMGVAYGLGVALSRAPVLP